MRVSAPVYVCVCESACMSGLGDDNGGGDESGWTLSATVFQTRNTKPDEGFDRGLNLMNGSEGSARTSSSNPRIYLLRHKRGSFNNLYHLR